MIEPSAEAKKLLSADELKSLREALADFVTDIADSSDRSDPMPPGKADFAPLLSAVQAGEEESTRTDWDDTFPTEEELTDDWQESVTPAYASLLEAEPVDDEDDETLSNALAAGILLAIWLYSRDTGRYLKPETREPLSDRELDLILSDRISDTKKRLDKISKQYQKDTNADRWEDDALEVVRRSHIEAYVLGRGGLNAIADDDIERLRQLLNEQGQFLKTFKGELDDLTPLRIENRLRMYAQSALSSYHAGKDAAMKASGYQFEAWRLSNAEHCKGCIKQMSRGKVAIGGLPAIGSQDCLWNCKCSKTYYKA
jgi:hypothetical protein